MVCVLVLIAGIYLTSSGVKKGVELSKQNKEHLETVDNNKKQLLEVEFPQKGFSPTSAYYQYGDGTARGEYTMFVDSKSKKIAFVFDFKDVKYLNFNEIRSCEIVVVEGDTYTDSNLMSSGVTSSVTVSKLLINITTTNIDNPLLSIDVLHCEEKTDLLGQMVAGRWVNVDKNTPKYRKSVEFTSKVKSVIDNIVSA